MGWVAAAAAFFLLQQAAAPAGNPAREGLKALEEERYEEAAQAFEKAIEAHPEDYGSLFNLAFAYTMLGRKQEAIAGYEKVLALKPGLYQAELNLGILLVGEKKAERAIPYLQAAAQQKPSAFRPNYYLAEALYMNGDDAGAERYYRKAAEIDPTAPDVQIGLGRAVFNQGRYEEAETYYRKAAELDARYKTYLLELGTRYEEKDKAEAAIRIYRLFLDKPVVQERLGHLLLRLGRAEEALPHLVQAVSLSPTQANRFALAMAYIKTRQPDKALPLLDEVLAEDPKNYDILMIRGRLLRDQRRFGPAAQDFLRAVEARPDSQEAWKELAGMLILLEDYPRALAALDRVEALGKAPASIHFFRGMIWDKAHQYEKALASYQKFLALSNNEFPDEEFKARQRIKVIQRELRR